MVRDKLYFSWTRWMSYGLCFLAGWMWNHDWGAYEENQILKMLLRWSWRNVKINMDVKAEVLPLRSQVRGRISKKSIVKFVMESFEFNIFSKDKMEMHIKHNWSLSMPRRWHLSNPREKEVINLEWRKLIFSQGGWL